MIEESNLSDSAVYQLGNCLIASLNNYSDESSISRTGKVLLKQLKIKRAKGVIIDLSDVTILSSNEFAILKNVARSVAMMGTSPVFAGFQPGVAASLVDLEAGCDDIMTARNLDDAFTILTNLVLD